MNEATNTSARQTPAPNDTRPGERAAEPHTLENALRAGTMMAEHGIGKAQEAGDVAAAKIRAAGDKAAGKAHGFSEKVAEKAHGITDAVVEKTQAATSKVVEKAHDLGDVAVEKYEVVAQQARDLGHATSDLAQRAGDATTRFAGDAGAAVRHATVATGGFAAAHALPLLTIGAGLGWLAWSIRSQAQKDKTRAARRTATEARIANTQPPGNKLLGVRDARTAGAH